MAKPLAIAVLVTAALGCGPGDVDIVLDRGDDRLRLRDILPVHVDESYLYFTASGDLEMTSAGDAGLYRIAREGAAGAEQLYSLPGLRFGAWTDGEVVLVVARDGTSNLVAVRLDGSVAWERAVPDMSIGDLAWTDGYLLAMTFDGAIVRLDAESVVLLAQTEASPPNFGWEMIHAEAGYVYWLGPEPGIARIAIDGSESEPTLLNADLFSDYPGPGVEYSSLVGVHDGELLVATMIVVEPDGRSEPAIIEGGGIHTVVPEGETPRMLTDQIVLAAKSGDAVLGLNRDGDGVRLDLATGELRDADQRADYIPSITHMLAGDDTLFFRRWTGAFWDRIEAIRFGR